MIIKIKKLEGEIKIISADQILEIKEESTTWNSSSINEFLIAIFTKDSEGELELEFDNEETDSKYTWIVKLFKTMKSIYENSALKEGENAEI